ncbi:MAG: beta-propeller domain-containing protein, partial [Candidatus Peribacteraceae bacterium]|nr:beta-propeller domain-containing protein [Candidatus Peribacteraceae bacterium]
VYQGAYVYDISLKDGLKLRGTITHYTEEDYQKAGGYLYGKDIERVVRLGDSLLTISEDGVQSHAEETVRYEGGMRYVTHGTDCPGASEAGVAYVSTDTDTCATLKFTCPEGKSSFSGACGCGCR